jgi:hypothetical protein
MEFPGSKARWHLVPTFGLIMRFNLLGSGRLTPSGEIPITPLSSTSFVGSGVGSRQSALGCTCRYADVR